MIAYKLFKQRKDGTIGSLFMNPKERIPLNKWLTAKGYIKKGFAYRPYWHTMEEPVAPHLSGKGRAWYKVEIKNYKKFKRPSAQGKFWLLAKKIKVLEKL